MGNEIKLTLIANAGVILEYGGTSILVDGIFGGEGHCFDSPDAMCRRSILEGEGDFSHIDYLLFTHTHPDHFSAEMVLEYLKRRQVKGILLPAPETPPERLLGDYIQERRIPAVFLSHVAPPATYQAEGGVELQALPTRHLDKQFYNMPHFCYLIGLGGRRLLVTADVDYTTEDFSALGAVFLDGVFVNPMFFHSVCVQSRFRTCLSYERVLVYHVPTLKDKYNYGRMLKRDIARWPEDREKPILLDCPRQSVKLPPRVRP